MSQITSNHAFSGAQTIVGEPEVVEDIATHPSWLALKEAASALRPLEIQDGSIPDQAAHPEARGSRRDHHDRTPEFPKAVPARRRVP